MCFIETEVPDLGVVRIVAVMVVFVVVGEEVHRGSDPGGFVRLLVCSLRIVAPRHEEAVRLGFDEW
jgi:hypothetical protein